MRALIARLMLKPQAVERDLGNVTLAAHQVDAVARIRDALTEFGGALLCDVVGSGKTFIGLAVAGAAQAVIIAPASLREMWLEAMRRTNVHARYFSVEALSRSCPDIRDAEILIVDEAHHFRNASTLRHKTLARLIPGRRILMMTATPIHNSKTDLESLASLFLGNKASTLSEQELGRLIVRRNRERVTGAIPIPTLLDTQWMTIGDDSSTVRKIIALPPGVPVRDAGEAHALAAIGLVRQWTSSEAAFKAAIKRRITRASALEASLAAGELPSANELRSWVSGDDSIQLGFAGLLDAPPPSDAGELLRAIRAHRDGMRQLMAAMTGGSVLDARRAGCLVSIAHAHRDALIVAFASYEATALALFRSVAPKVRAAALTSSGGMVAGGRVTREKIIEQFDPAGRAPREADRIQLLVTTDLLSEGVNLQNAQVVVHLDLPWTQARIDQREGRLARIGSRHRTVMVYGFRPPPSADEVLRVSALIMRKARDARAVLGRDTTRDEPHDVSAPSPEAQENMREILTTWLAHNNTEYPGEDVVASAVAAEREGFLALIETGTGFFLICHVCAGISNRPADIAYVCRLACGSGAAVDRYFLTVALDEINEWLTNGKAAELAGIGPSAFLATRRKILRRIDSLAVRVPPYRRHRRAQFVQSARQAATAAHGAAAENDLASLATNSTGVEDDEWLFRVAKIGARQKASDSRAGYKLRALLLLAPATPPPSS